MRNRRVQREMRRSFGKEEIIDLYDFCGIKDPTPYQAVKNIVKEDKAKKVAYARATVRERADKEIMAMA